MKPINFQSRRPIDSYEFERVTELRRKGRGWQDVASAIGRSLEDTLRLYGPESGLPRLDNATPALTAPVAPKVSYDPNRVYTFQDRVTGIVRGVCQRHGVTLEELKGAGRAKRISQPRHELMALLLDAGKSTTWTGIFLGGRDHATVLYGARSHKARVRRAKEAA